MSEYSDQLAEDVNLPPEHAAGIGLNVIIAKKRWPILAALYNNMVFQWEFYSGLGKEDPRLVYFFW